MKALKASELINQYATCPDCGSEKVGNKEGLVSINDNVFKRECKCGWKVKITVGD